jgi:hypothetical protein
MFLLLFYCYCPVFFNVQNLEIVEMLLANSNFDYFVPISLVDVGKHGAKLFLSSQVFDLLTAILFHSAELTNGIC